MQHIPVNQRPNLLTSLMNMSLVLRLPRDMHLCRSSANLPRLPSFLDMPQNPHVLLTFKNSAVSIAPATRNDIWTSEPSKVVRARGVFTILTWKCALRHNGVHFFHMSTSKNGPNLVCFVHVDLEMCFAPKFSPSQLERVVRTWYALYILTWKCASRHNGVQFFISHLASWLRTRRFSEPTFPPSGATNHWKNTVFRDFATFSHTWIFFLLRLSLFFFLLLFSSLTLPISALHLSILSEIWLLNFLLLDIYIYIYVSYIYIYVSYIYICICIIYIYIYHICIIYIYISYISYIYIYIIYI